MKTITFTKNVPNYTAGQTAFFPENIAENYINIGVAKEYVEPKKNPPMPEKRTTGLSKMIKKSKGS